MMHCVEFFPVTDEIPWKKITTDMNLRTVNRLKVATDPWFFTHDFPTNTAKSDLNCHYYKEHQRLLITGADSEN